MSGFNARFALPADERPLAYGPGVKAAETAAATPMGGAPAEADPRAPLTPTDAGAPRDDIDWLEIEQARHALATASDVLAEIATARLAHVGALERNAAERFYATVKHLPGHALRLRRIAGGR